MSKRFSGAIVLGLSIVLFCAGCSGRNSATPAAAGKITVSDTANPQNDSVVSFGTIAAGYSSMEAVVVTNNGNGALAIGQIAVTDALATPFSIALDTCSGAILAPGSKCDLMIRFAPSTSGLFTDIFDIPSNDPDYPETAVGVMGTGTYAVPVPHMVLTDSVAPADDRILLFGSVNLSTASTRTITIGNDGTVNLVIGQIGQVYKLIGPFVIADTCSGQSIAPSQTCVFTVEFHPNSSGDFSGGFDIPSNDSNGSVGFGVAGTGVDLISPARLQFGNVATNQTSDLAVTITNNGAVDLVIGQIAGLDPLAAPFSIVSDGCSNQTLVPAASCLVTVRFAPTNDGFYSDTFDVPTSGDVTGDIPVSVNGLSGSGTVSGTITLPLAAVSGKCYAVVLTQSFNPTSPLQGAVAVASGATAGTTISYSFSTVPPGQYYLFAGVDNDGNNASAPACSFSNVQLTSGDFYGFYGGGFSPNPNVTVNVGTNTFDFSLTTY